MDEASDDPRNEIEHKVPLVSKCVFHVVAKDVKVEHVSNQMNWTAVNEHRSEDSVQLLTINQLGWNHSEVPDGIFKRKRTIKPQKLGKPADQKDCDIDYQEDSCYMRCG